MISDFDIIRLKEILKDFYILSKIRITIFNEEFEEIVSYPDSIPDFCSMIRSDSVALSNCRQCDIKACAKAKSLRRNYIYSCHAGLTEAITPIQLDGLIIGYMLFGHIAPNADKKIGWASVYEHCKSYNVDIKALQIAYNKRRYFSKERINATSQIMETVAAYLCVSHMAGLRSDSLPIQIDTYITSHMNEEQLSIETLCEQFKISRTRLYQISAQNYGIGISEYIRKLRIEKARKLLTETSMPIKEVALAVRIDDYNYFTKVFKKMTGVTPRDYRKIHLGN